MKITRTWVMPNKWTFRMKPVSDLNQRIILNPANWADPFSGETSPVAITNDIREDSPAAFHLDALDFLRGIATESVEGVLFDPPYSVEQCLRKYTPKQVGTAGRAEYWSKCKDEISRIVKVGGKVISFGWDSVGMGKNRGFEIEEILLLCHGACHNDTIVTVDTKQGTK